MKPIIAVIGGRTCTSEKVILRSKPALSQAVI